MKCSLFAFLALSFVAMTSFATVRDNPDQAESDAVYAQFEPFDVNARVSYLAKLPETLQCGENQKLILANLFSNGISNVIRFSRTDIADVVFNLNDGDQVLMLKLKGSDLEDLASGETESIKALEASGYWWADGDHVTAREVTCQK